jgi:predicted phage terminase large subunit-like protein
LKELARRKTPDSVYAYGEYVFGYKAAPHHKELVGEILKAVSKAGTDEAEHVVIEEPRGSAKTTWGDTITLAWLVSQFPHLRIGLMSKTSDHAKDFSRAIRWTIEHNDRQHEVFPEIKPSAGKWTDAQWLVDGSPWLGSNFSNLFAQGAGGQIASKRFDVILCDDILDEENSKTPEQRASVEEWFWKTLYPCLAPNGVIIVIGTRWTEDDIYQKLTDPPEKGGRGWRLVLRKAYYKRDDPTIPEYLLDPEYIERYADEERIPLWADVWPLSKLDKVKADQGSAFFACAYLNDITGLMEGNVFLSRNFQHFSKLDPGKGWTVRMGIDLASSERQTADYTARVVTAEDQEGNYYVLSVYRDRRETGHAAFVNDGYEAFPNISIVLVEKNAFQSTLVQEILRDYPSIPIEGKPTDTDKVTRARAVAAKYEGHKVWHHESLRDSDFEIELLAFKPGASHDDMVDALGFSMDLAGGNFSFTSARRN